MNTAHSSTEENIKERLFLRFFAVYLVIFPIAILAIVRGAPAFMPQNIALFQFLMVPLALLGGLMTVSRVYLFFACAVKSISDANLFLHVTRLVRTGAVGILQWNACFFLLTLSLLLFSCSCAGACHFSFSCKERDLKLIFSRSFGTYLIKMLIFTLLALSLYLLFSRLEGLLPC